MIEKYCFNKNIKLKRNVACIGLFDGVHRGHQELINKTIDLSKQKDLMSMIITFYPDPIEVIKGNKVQQILNYEERIAMFDKLGLDSVLTLKFDVDFMKLSAQDFMEQVLDKLNIDTLICGFDFRFGYLGQGNCETLKTHGYNLIVTNEKKYYGKKISSTRIREEITRKNYKLVNKLLGYEYRK